VGAVAQPLTGSNGRLAWLWRFLGDELAPYRGRTALAARMVTASTLVMILCMTFRIPYGAYAALFALTLSRESLEGTATAVRAMVIGFVLAGAYVLLGGMLVVGNAMLRFFWVCGTLFLVFYTLSALSSYAAAARFGYLTAITIPLWDNQISANSRVESTLWAVGAITIASVITLLLEIAFAEFRRADDLIEALTERLVCVEELFDGYLDHRPANASTRSALARLASVGTSRLRRMLQRSGYEPQRQQQLGAVVALVGRLVDIAANLPQFSGTVTDDDRNRIRKVLSSIADSRATLTGGTALRAAELPGGDDGSPTLPFLVEAEKTVSLLHEVLTGAQSMTVYAPSENREPATPFVRGALSNPEHVKFALRGSLAAGLCYIVYNSLFWPGISTAITTCLLTALTTIGASHQKQFLRFAGALVGGLIIGMGAQVFILPNIDSIGAFAVLFAAVAGLSAWFATSSSRLSYFGVQIAVAFYLINLQEFKIQTSLAVARDRVVGVLLGLFMMWLTFDLLWSAPAGVEMKKAFVSVLRLLAQLAIEPVSNDAPIAIERTYALRETIDAQFDKVRALADGVLFEFGPSRQRDLALRDRIREWQPTLRSLFLMRIASLKYRLQLPGFELPDAVRLAHQDYDSHSAWMLDEMADWIEGVVKLPQPVPLGSLRLLEQSVQEHSTEASAAHIRSFLALIHRIDSLTSSVAEKVAIDFRPA
jgi:multidrug resistance protein MdtO